jgi:raffinose/stachyose/melibiose transport system permease protein
MRNSSKTKEVLIYIGLIIWMIVNLFPVYWMFTFSLKSNPEIFGENVIGLPKEWLWSNYSTALHTGNMGLYFMNSAIVAISTIIITLCVALMATFALTRLIWKGRKTLNKFFMLGLTIPIHASIVPVYVTLSKLNMLNTYWALIIPYSAFSLAMAILVCVGFMNEIPRELDESACIDGCGVFGVFFRIIVPLMRPAVATVGIYTFLQCWNELMFANVFISKNALRTLPVGVQALSGQYTTEWGPIGAALVLATFPTLFVYIFLSKKIQESFIAGAIKG